MNIIYKSHVHKTSTNTSEIPRGRTTPPLIDWQAGSPPPASFSTSLTPSKVGHEHPTVALSWYMSPSQPSWLSPSTLLYIECSNSTMV